MGDVLLAAAFVSYASPFNTPLREMLVKERWHPDILSRNIPMSDGITPLEMLTDDATKARCCYCWPGSREPLRGDSPECLVLLLLIHLGFPSRLCSERCSGG